MNITVLIAAYNAEGTIGEAVESAVRQRLPGADREIVIVNDGSTDRTREVLARFDGRVRILDEPHRGLAGACNVGLAAARGQYFVRLDADDRLAPDALLSMSRCLAASREAAFVYSDRLEIFPDGRRVRVSLAEFNVFRTIACGVLFQTQTARAIGGYADLLFEEYDFLMRYLTADPRRIYVPEVLYHYTRRASGMTEHPLYWEQGWKQILQKWGEAELARWNYREVFRQA
jgi:glycosyltransferase involved in cell wall biosynthesis